MTSPVKVSHVEEFKFNRGKVRRYCYSNGAVFLHNTSNTHHGFHLTVNFWGGSRRERSHEQGMTHLLEHLIFKRDISNNLNKVALIESFGAELNAYTSKEYTSFELIGLSTRLKDVFTPFLELVLNPTFDEKWIAQEKKVVMQELREDAEDFDLAGKEHLFKLAFPEGLAHPIGGTITGVKRFHINEIKRFWKRSFSPEHLVICLNGHSVSTPYFQKEVNKLFNYLGLCKKAKPKRPKLKSGMGHLNPPFHKVIVRDMELASVLISYTGASLGGDDLLTCYLINSLLSEGMSSRLYQNFRENNPLIYGPSSSVHSFSDNGSLEVSFSCKKEDIDFLVKGVKNVIKDFALKGAREEELLRVKRQMLDYFLLRFDQLEERNTYIVMGEFCKAPLSNFTEFKKRVERVNQEDIKQFASKMMAKGTSVLIIRGPLRKRKK